MLLRLLTFGIALCSIGTISAQNYALRFLGTAYNDQDRVKIPIDNPPKAADVGANFTIEFKLRATQAENLLGGSVTSGFSDDWVLGHVIIDRDVFGPGDYGDYGISLAGGRIAFGINNGTIGYTLVSNLNIADDQWHDVAVTRSNDGFGTVQIFIDGVLSQTAQTGVTGDLSYRDGRATVWPNDPYLVFGAEKHDYDPTLYPSFSGYLDEVRISNVVRYTTNYSPAAYHQDDASTLALYHFDEGAGQTITDAALLAGNNSQGFLTVNQQNQPITQWVLVSGAVAGCTNPPAVIPSPAFSA